MVWSNGFGQMNFEYFFSDSQRPFDYNAITSSNFLKDSTYVFEELQDTWSLKNKNVYSYDLQGNEILLVESNLVDNSWVNVSKSEKAYSNSQTLIYERISIWEENNQSWKYFSRSDFLYGPLNILESKVDYARNNNLWERELKTEYDYNQLYLIEVISQYDWDSDLEQWFPSERTLFDYNEDENLEREVLQLWNDSLQIWVNSKARNYNYDEHDKLISSTRSAWSKSEQSWISQSMVSMLYNDKGQVQSTKQVELRPNSEQNLTSQDVTYDSEGNLGQTIISNWNESSGEWESVTKKVHFWSQNITGNLGGKDGEIACSFMNPYVLGLSWKCNSLKEDVMYTVEVYDLWGRRHFADQFRGNRAFRIHGNIPPGVYTVIIRGGIDVHTEKIIIKG